MTHESARTKAKVQSLQDRIAELEKQLEQARDTTRSLEMERTRLAIVLEHLPVGVWITDDTGRLISKNKQADQIWAGNAPLVDSVSEYQQYVAWYTDRAAPLEPDEYPVARTLRTRQEVGPVELRIRRFDGSDGTVLVSAVPIHDASNAFMGVAGINVDVTDRKWADEQLRTSRSRIDDILGSLGDGLFALDRNWSIIYINQYAAELAGLPVQELVGKNLWSLWPELVGTPTEAHYRQAMEQGLPANFRIQGSKSARWYDVAVYPSSEGITIYFVNKTDQVLAEERFNKAFHASPYALVISRQQDGRIETVNGSFLEFFGYQREAVIGRTSTELGMFAHAEDRQEAVRRLQHQGSIRDFELDVRLKSGESRTVSLSVEVINIGDEPLMLTTIQDITLRKQAEQALRESEQRYRRLFETMQEGLVLAEVLSDEAGNPIDYRYVDVNPATEKQFGIPRETFIGHTYTEVLPNEDREWIEVFGRVVRTGQPLSIERYVKATRKWFRCHLYLSRRGHVVNLMTDITEHKQFESALQKRETILAQAGKLAHLGAWDIEIDDPEDLSTSPLSWSDEVYRIFGYKPGEIEPSNQLFFERVHIQDRALVQQQVAQAIAKRQPYMIEHRICRLDGEERVVQEHAEIFFDESGKPVRIIGAVQDITDSKRAEDALREAELKYRTLVEQIPNAVVYIDSLDPEIGSFYVSPQIEMMLGYTAEEWQSNPRSWHEHLYPEDRQRLLEEDAHHESTGQPFSLEYRLIAGDGRTVWVHDEAVMIHDADGQPKFSQGIMIDITDRKLAEDALRASEARMRAVFQSLVEGVVFLNTKGEVEEINAAVQSSHGHTLQELSDPQLDPRGKIIRPDGTLFPEEEQPAIVALRTGQTVQNVEMGVPTMDGKIRWRLVNAQPVYDEQGVLLGAVASFFDITNQKQAEQSVRESEKHFRFLADSMPQLVWTALPDGTVDYYNQRHQEYHNITQVKGETWKWSPVLHPDDRDMTFAAWLNSVVTGATYQVEHRVRMRDGSYRWHLSRGVPVHTEDGRIARWFGTATDIHDFKMAEEGLKDYADRLERSNKELEQFAFMASHDLQEPLRKIEMFGDLLLINAETLDERSRGYLERMRSAAGRMRAMVSGLLQLSRVATQGKPFTSVDLSQVAADVLNDLESQIRRTGGMVSVEHLPVIEGDPVQLRQLLQNLVGNALKYHRAGAPPEVKVTAAQSSDRAQLMIEDKGIGFEQEDAERVFQPFQRLVGRSEYEGSGMGLAICRRIVQRHAGTISVVSKPGEGSTFFVTLPIHHPKQKSEHGKDA